MTAMNMNATVSRYFELSAQVEALNSEMESIKDLLKLEMMTREVEDLDGEGWRATWHNVSNRRFDGKALRRDNPALYERYMVSSTGTRFTLNRLDRVEA